ncbi:hypothetical protein CMO88_00890 [Candidatus Woesearchaeota archaeon]|jgi:2-polyprenyl-3-methyl-5-hydroxy-6-metoxy-1,4-benzoquinol methylase|nr:hypothetical protein [Candidatus Woesearchaeota archaeon]|tara:strand:- start:15976 stop:16467 length:492 start_codon:yes stop_codon:yes gene_type:complete
MNLIIPITKRIRAHHAKKHIQDLEGKTILDIGCADGYFGRSLKKAKVTGIDITLGQDAEKGLKFPDNSFDYVVMLAVIEHFKDHTKVLKEVKRVLKDGGVLVVTTPFHKAEKFINLYASRHEEGMQHTRNFVKQDFENFEGFNLTHHSTFEFGLNQVAVLRKK